MNNVFANYSPGGSNSRRYCIFLNCSPPKQLNNNTFFNISGSNNYLGYINSQNCSTLTAWQTASGKEKNSYFGDPGFLSASNLLPDTTSLNCWNLKGKGMPLSLANNDYRGLPRSITTPAGPTCIGAYEFQTTIAPPLATPSGSPSSGETTSYLQSNKKLLDITWGSSEKDQNKITEKTERTENTDIKNQKSDSQYQLTDNRSEAKIHRGGLTTKPDALPTTVDVQYYSGVTPLDTTNIPSPKFSKGFWKVDCDAEPASPVNVKIYWGDQELGTINDTSKLILAMYDMKNRVWLPFERGTSGNGYSIMDNANKTITVNGIPRIDSVCFALTAYDAPLKRFKFDLTVNIEGIYDGVSAQALDSVWVFLRQLEANSYAKIDSAFVPLNANGVGSFFTSKSLAVTGSLFWIQIKHRNAIETWCDTTTTKPMFSRVTGTSLYDFTTAQTQAWGANLVLKGTKYCIYSGDVTFFDGQSGFIDGTDVTKIDSANVEYSDDWMLDLDNTLFVDGTDVTICDLNNVNYVGVVRPDNVPSVPKMEIADRNERMQKAMKAKNVTITNDKNIKSVDRIKQAKSK